MEEITIFTTYDSFEADRVRAALESEKIPSYKKSHGAGDYLGVYFGRTNILRKAFRFRMLSVTSTYAYSMPWASKFALHSRQSGHRGLP